MKTLTDNHLDAAITGWVTPAWASELLGRRQRTIRRWAQDGDLPTWQHPMLGLMVDMATCAHLDRTRPRQKQAPHRRKRPYIRRDTPTQSAAPPAT